jgi:hypothetical protein
MATLQIEHGVRSFEAWKQAFDGDPVGRKAGGVRRHEIFRPSDGPSRAIVHLEFDSVGEAEASPSNFEGCGSARAEELGLDGPSARVLEIVEDRTY